MPRRPQYDEDDFDHEDDEHEDVCKLRRQREDNTKLEKKKPWDRESVPDFDERR